MNLEKLIALTILLTISLSSNSLAQVIPSTPNNNQPQITVTGQAEVQVPPDLVVLTLGVDSRDRELEKAKKENDEKAKASIAALKKAGVDPDDIQTDYFNVEPRFDHPSNKIEYYIIRKRIVVKLRKVSDFESVISSAISAGANIVQGIDFRTTKLREFKDKARSLAIRAAEEKAIALSSELKQTIGKPVKISEMQSGMWSWYSSWWHRSSYAPMSQNVSTSVGSGSSGGEGIAPGKIKITASVSVTFELKNKKG